MGAASGADDRGAARRRPRAEGRRTAAARDRSVQSTPIRRRERPAPAGKMIRRALLLFALVFASLLVSCEDTDSRTVVLWHAYRGDEERAIEEVARAFERAHPGVRVELLSVPFEAYLSKLESAAPRGHGPDVFIDAHTRLGAYEETNVLAKLPDGVLDASAYDASAIAASGGFGVPLSTKSV